MKLSIVAAIMKVLPTPSDGNLPLSIRITVWWFKIIGLAPFTLQRNETRIKNHRSSSCTSAFLFSKMGVTYNILLSIIFIALGAFAIPAMSSMRYPNRSSINQVIDVMNGTSRTLTSCFIILYWALKQKNAVSIMNRLLEVDSVLTDMEIQPSSQRTSFMIVTVQMVINLLLWVIFWASEEEYIFSFMHWYIFNVPIFLVQWFAVEYFIVLGVLAIQLRSLNKNLLKFKEFPVYLFRTPPLPDHNSPTVSSLPTQCSELAALELLHNIRTMLSEVSQDIADFFSLPILPAVACFAVVLIYNSYFFSTPIIIPINDPPISLNINSGAWMLVCIYPLILISFNVAETLKEAKLTGLIVHKLLATAKEQEIQTELERFSLHLIHESLSFTAYGFFTLDFTLIQSIFGITVTYLVIVIQFIQSAAQTFDSRQL